MPKKQPAPESPIEARLREAIRTSGKSLNEIAKSSGVAVAQLSRFMRRERGLTLAAAGKVCKALGLKLTEEDNP